MDRAKIKRIVDHPEMGLIKTVRDPDVLRGHIRMQILRGINDILGERINTVDGGKMADRDWDVLIILDACRYDAFEDCISMDGELTKEQSVAPETRSFLEENFSGEELHDTVYVSANPNVPTVIPSETFHSVVPVWKNEWDEELGTVLPSTVTKFARKAAEEYPQKRLIVHYNQPHQPFVGEEGREFMFEHDLRGINALSNRRGLSDKLYYALTYGLLDVSDERIRELYEENLNTVLDSVYELLNDIKGKAIITSDHGELLGDRVGVLPMKGYGHPTQLHVRKLLEVPWFEVPYDQRRKVQAEPRDATNRVDMQEDGEEVKQKLRDLGYMQ